MLHNGAKPEDAPFPVHIALNFISLSAVSASSKPERPLYQAVFSGPTLAVQPSAASSNSAIPQRSQPHILVGVGAEAADLTSDTPPELSSPRRSESGNHAIRPLDQAESCPRARPAAAAAAPAPASSPPEFEPSELLSDAEDVYYKCFEYMRKLEAPMECREDMHFMLGKPPRDWPGLYTALLEAVEAQDEGAFRRGLKMFQASV